jgi:hypothetical protein
MDILGFVGVISESERSELYGQTERLCCGCGGTAVEQKSLERVTLQSRTRPIGAVKMMDPLQPPDGSAPVAHPPLCAHRSIQPFRLFVSHKSTAHLL